ncbi:MAG: hypothetical protein U0904_09715 [Candidatus Nanopelagicales bacterium]|nr:hypothetical protein [Candidatus Nanopelagicales bacterium]
MGGPSRRRSGAGPPLGPGGIERRLPNKWGDPHARLPFELVGLDLDNGSEFVNHGIVGWARDEGIELTRARPCKSNDNTLPLTGAPPVEQKNADVVHQLAFHYRYDTDTEVELLNEFYGHARLRFNLFTATRKAVGWAGGTPSGGKRPGGRKVRVTTGPRPRWTGSSIQGVLSQAKTDELIALKQATNPALGRPL